MTFVVAMLKSFEGKNTEEKTQIVFFGIFITTLIVSLFYLHRNLCEISQFIVYGDEPRNIFSLQNILKYGVPWVGYFPKSFLYNYNPFAFIDWPYAVELYLRFPIFMLGKVFKFDWRTASSLFYLYAVFGAFLFFVFRKKKPSIPWITLSYFSLLFCLYRWSAQSFHFVRYYPFTLISITAAHFICTYLLLCPKRSFPKKCGTILIIAFIPALFHGINILYFEFWFSLLSFLTIKNISMKLELGPFIKFKRISLVLIVFFVSLVTLFFVSSRFYFANFFDIRSPLVFLYFFNLVLTGNAAFFILVVLLMVLFFHKYLDTYEKYLLMLSTGFLVFVLTFFSVYGGYRIIILKESRYLLCILPCWFAMLSVMFSTVFKAFFKKIIPSGTYWLYPLVFWGIIFLFLGLNIKSINHSFSYIFTAYEAISKKQLETIKQIVRDSPGCIILVDDGEFGRYYFPENKVYIYRKCPVIQDPNKLSHGLFYKDRRGWMRDIYGSVYVNDRESFCRVVRENKDKNILFYNCNLQNVSLQMSRELWGHEAAILNSSKQNIQDLIKSKLVPAVLFKSLCEIK